jgi:hypothetical protein
MNETDVLKLVAYLWPKGDSLNGLQVHMLLDGARDPAIEPMICSGKLEYNCLFGGSLVPRLQAAAPYLIHLAAESPLTHELLMRGWSNNWGFLTLATPDVTIMQQRLHFKKFLRVQDEDGIEMAFRFYDPRVLRIYLPSCTEEESRRFFGPISRMIMACADSLEPLDFSLQTSRLVQRNRAMRAPGREESTESQ